VPLYSHAKTDAVLSAAQAGYLVISVDDVPGGWPEGSAETGDPILPLWLQRIFAAVKIAVVQRAREVRGGCASSNSKNFIWF